MNPGISVASIVVTMRATKKADNTAPWFPVYIWNLPTSTTEERS